jgi:hypothetical protein
MWITELRRRLQDHFGSDYASSWAKDFVLPELGGISVDQALALGFDPQTIWKAVVENQGLGPSAH